MNPFTESTVARPLSESPTQAVNDDSTLNDIPQHNARSNSQSVPKEASPADAEPVKASNPVHKPARYPRSGRLIRRRGRSLAARRAIAALWQTHCPKAVGAALGLALAFALPAAAWAVNVNSASAQQLETITGIGPKTAQVIIDERTRGGSFDSFDDLAERVKGIGAKKVRSLQAAGLTVGQAGNADSKPSTPPAPRKAGR